jgi:predicted flavoprotein YhiN
MSMESHYDLIVIGGGAAGYFGAINVAITRPNTKILIIEQSKDVLNKVRISGGGRCNVTHHCFEPKALTSFYPRGQKALLGPFHRFNPEHTLEWCSDQKRRRWPHVSDYR